jgi:outer membrane protein OmpA-like peptidoglycan-associated protein
MAKRKAKPAEEREDLWAYYQSIQRTPEQKAETRKRLEAKCEEAARNGVYERVLALVGKVKFDLDVDELREDRD